MTNPENAIQLAEDGTPVIAGTDVPVQSLLEHLQAGGVLTDFVEQHPEIDADTAVRVIELAWHALSDQDDQSEQ